MGHDRGIGCRTCPQNGGHATKMYIFDNCRNSEEVAQLIERREDLLVAYDLLGDWLRIPAPGYNSYERSLGANFFDWLVQHQSHELAIVLDYGGYEDQCYQVVKCDHCNTQQRCMRTISHEGRCSLTRVV